MEGETEFGPMMMGVPSGGDCKGPSEEELAARKAKQELAENLSLAQMSAQTALMLAQAAHLLASARETVRKNGGDDALRRATMTLAEQAQLFAEITKVE